MAVWSIVTKKYVEKKVRIDAEYYKPEFIRLENDILKWNKISELNYLASVTGGKRLPKGEIFSPEGVPYVRVVDIKNIEPEFLFFFQPADLPDVAKEYNGIDWQYIRGANRNQLILRNETNAS